MLIVLEVNDDTIVGEADASVRGERKQDRENNEKNARFRFIILWFAICGQYNTLTYAPTDTDAVSLLIQIRCCFRLMFDGRDF